MRALRGSSGSGSVQAGLVVRFDFHDAVAARITNEFLDASTLVSFDTVPVMAGPGNQPSCWLVAVVNGQLKLPVGGRENCS